MIADCEFSTPGELARLLDEIKKLVASGALKQIWKPDALCANDESVSSIPNDGPWPDYVEMYFVDAGTGDEYKLVAETYHGSGGTWSRVD